MRKFSLSVYACLIALRIILSRAQDVEEWDDPSWCQRLEIISCEKATFKRLCRERCGLHRNDGSTIPDDPPATITSMLTSSATTTESQPTTTTESRRTASKGMDTTIDNSDCYNVDDDGESYRGSVAITENGNVCQKWADQSPHRHPRTPERYPEKGLESNYCRNPDFEGKPWCYTSNPNKRWEYCNIPQCQGDVIRLSYQPK